MNHLIILWLMTTPGHWERTVQVYDTYEECHEVVHFLKNQHPKARNWHKWYEYILEDVYSVGYMFEDMCKERPIE